MIDSLVGVGMLVLLTGWMAGLVSVQYPCRHHAAH